MSTGTIRMRQAFDAALNGKATCTEATMRMKRGDTTEWQELCFVVLHAGTEHRLTWTIEGSADPTEGARKCARNFLTTL